MKKSPREINFDAADRVATLLSEAFHTIAKIPVKDREWNLSVTGDLISTARKTCGETINQTCEDEVAAAS